MQQILDLHIHSKYSRACSPLLTLENIDNACRIKGVDIIATGDFTYPAWFKDIKNKLVEIKNNAGLFRLKTAKDDKIKFILSTEVALIYKDGGKTRRIHLVIHAPSLEAAEELNNYLDKDYNIRSDGRPILGMNASALVKLCLNIDKKFLIYPAHIWTPWFAIFGSKSGFDKIEECFHEYTENIYAFETGLSSDPAMNWRLSCLDNLTVLSNSDAHSLPNIGREANVFEMNKFTYGEIFDIIKNKKIYNKSRGSGIKFTIEFYPEEGLYHLDGHRLCKVRFTPTQTKKHKGICPVCKKPVVIGVMNRVEELSDRSIKVRPSNSADFKKLVELDKIIAETLNIKSRSSKNAQAEYNNIIKQGKNELNILLNISESDLKKITKLKIAEGIKRARQGKLIIEPGFDGQYGTTKIFKDNEQKKNQQPSLF
ncbi:endonuclease Q family protein [Patescibacteria group bacterium]|nr:endonuclease Q family protein [Patescibacteria group bacterium]